LCTTISKTGWAGQLVSAAQKYQHDIPIVVFCSVTVLGGYWRVVYLIGMPVFCVVGVMNASIVGRGLDTQVDRQALTIRLLGRWVWVGSVSGYQTSLAACQLAAVPPYVLGLSARLLA